MSAATLLRSQIEAILATRIPSALTPAPRIFRQVEPTNIRNIDALLQGGLPTGSITEIVGSECSGRTSMALSFIAGMTQSEKVCAWVDVSNAFHPESAAAAGVDLQRLLWVRCGVPLTTGVAHPWQGGFALPEKYFTPRPIKKGLHGGGFGPHPRNEVKDLSQSIAGLLQPETDPRCAGSQPKLKRRREICEPACQPPLKKNRKPSTPNKPWPRLEQALRVTDLLLQNGGFGAIVLDMASLAPEHMVRVPLATWFRYRAAAEQKQICILLLTQHACAKSSAALTLRLQSGSVLREAPTIFTGVEHSLEVARQRLPPSFTEVASLRKPPQQQRCATWQDRTAWSNR